jgi:pimeloyl-ACP methyl ester carboxylesterase
MNQLAAQLDLIGSKSSVDSITLICHSQGGQIARLMLESGTYSASANAWFAKIRRAMFICTPHMGAPKALAEFVGLESVDLVSASDIQIGARTWNSAYQLLPAPNAPGNPVIINDGAPEDFYQQSVAEILGLDPANRQAFNIASLLGRARKRSRRLILIPPRPRRRSRPLPTISVMAPFRFGALALPAG